MARMTNPRRLLCFSVKNARSTNPPPPLPYVFSSKTRLAFLVTVNSDDPRPTAPGFRIFFQLKRASREPFQIPCVFSSKTRLAFNVIVNLHVMLSIAPTFLFFFHIKCASQESCHIPQVHFHYVFSGTIGFTSHCEFACDLPDAVFFQGKTRLTGIAGKFQSWNKGIC